MTEVPLDCNAPAGVAVFELSTDWGADEEEAAAPEPQRVSVILIPGAVGYIPYQAKAGDTLADIVKAVSGGSTVSTIENAALASGLGKSEDPRSGQMIRVPV